jgi:hypothetical protein
MNFDTLPEAVKKKIVALLEHNKFTEAKKSGAKGLWPVSNSSAHSLSNNHANASLIKGCSTK